LGTIVEYSKAAKPILMPPLLFLQVVPKVALAPLVLVWMGLGAPTQVVVVILVCFFPIFVSTMSGLQDSDRGTLDLARSIGLSAGQTFYKIRLQSALPHLFSGLRVSATLAVIGIVIAEFVA